MNFFREVVARFGIVVDTAPLTQAEKNFDRVLAKVKSFAQTSTIVLAGVSLGFYNLVDAASHAEEALNVLQETFGKDKAKGVVEWTQLLEKELGRSEFMLQEASGKFGAFLTPVMKDSKEDIVQMSEQLTQLGVDLASFYDTSDEKAFMDLKSGISGETEAVRKYGINLADQRLQEMNIKDGGGSYAALTLAEKTSLRFKAIMIDTQIAQGDAMRTAGSWANMVRRVEGQFLSLRVELGRRLMPLAKSLISGFSTGLKEVSKWMKFMVDETKNLQVALAAVAYYLTATLLNAALWYAALIPAGQFAVVMRAAFLEVTLLAGALATVFLLWEDIYTFMTGGDSVMGRFITALTGAKNPLGAMNRGFEVMKNHLNDSLKVMKELVRWVWQVVKGLALIFPGTTILAPLLGGENPLSSEGWTNFMKGFDFSFDPGLTDWRQGMIDKDNAREAKFQEAVANAKNDEDLDNAAKSFGRENFSVEEERARAFDSRQTMVLNGQIAPTEADVASGFGNSSVYNPSTSSKSVVNNVTINVEKAGATAEEIADQVSYTLDERNQSEEYMSGEYE